MIERIGRRLTVVILLIGLLAPTIGPLFAAATPPSSSLPLGYSVVLPPGYFYDIPVESFSNATTLIYQVTSNVTISTSLMTSSQFNLFNESTGEITNAVFSSNGTSSQNSFHIPQSTTDYLVFYEDTNTANMTYSVEILPDNPFQLGQLPAPEALGVASYGLYNNSGSLVSYQISTDEVVGAAGISALAAHNATAGESGSNISGATLQLNAVLVVQENGGGQQVYWCQNTPDFVTATGEIALVDNVWNYSVSGLLGNDTVTSQGGLGYVYSFESNGTTGYYYSNSPTNSSYSLPLGLALVMNESAIPGTGVLVQMGARTFWNGTATDSPTDWFDNVTVHDTNIQSAYFLVSGNATTPADGFYDAELVFGGEGNGESTTFTQMNSTLGLYYSPGTGGPLQSFPSLLSVGVATGESADNLHVSYAGDGLSSVSVGTPNYSYLGLSSGTFSLANPSLKLQSSSSSSGASSTASKTAQTTASSSALSGPSVYLMIGEIIAVVVVMSAALAKSHRNTTSRR